MRPQPAQVEPLTAERSRLHVTVSRRLLEKLSAARDVLSHSHPAASEETILEVGLDLILERHAKRRGIGARPRRSPPLPPLRGERGDSQDSHPPAQPRGGDAQKTPPSPPPGEGDAQNTPPSPPQGERAGVRGTSRSRHVPAAVARAVWERDRGCCAWPLESGGVCASTYQVRLYGDDLMNN